MRLSDTQVRALLDAYDRADLEVHTGTSTWQFLCLENLARHVGPKQGHPHYAVVLTDAGRDLVWSWHNPLEAARD